MKLEDVIKPQFISFEPENKKEVTPSEKEKIIEEMVSLIQEMKVEEDSSEQDELNC